MYLLTKEIVTFSTRTQKFVKSVSLNFFITTSHKTTGLPMCIYFFNFTLATEFADIFIEK
mgnify:CR=1 FL=1